MPVAVVDLIAHWVLSWEHIASNCRVLITQITVDLVELVKSSILEYDTVEISEGITLLHVEWISPHVSSVDLYATVSSLEM